MRIQLWSYNYDPEPSGIGPVSTVLARGLRERGHDVAIVAAHPHYPEPRWGSRRLPYRERRDGIDVLRLPLWIGRDTALARYRQELSFMIVQTAALPFLSAADVFISASPCFPALAPAVLQARLRDVPWVLWLHDLLPDGATATGLLDDAGLAIRLARGLERTAYAQADRIVVLSRAFTANLRAKGVPEAKLELIYDPATRVPSGPARAGAGSGGLRVLSMGNIGHSQGLTVLVRAFESRPELAGDTELRITGTGVAAQEARAQVRTPRVHMLGMVSHAELETELRQADVALVTQRHEGAEFNIPSKLMNFMAYGLPVLAAVNPDGEVARIVRESGAGWVVDSGDPDSFPRELERLAHRREEIADRAQAARRHAEAHFTQPAFAAHFEATLNRVLAQRARAA